MKNDDIIFVGDNVSIFVNNSAVNKEQLTRVYAIYNKITGETKKPNGCGRCWRNVKTRVYQEYLKKVNII